MLFCFFYKTLFFLFTSFVILRAFILILSTLTRNYMFSFEHVKVYENIFQVWIYPWHLIVHHDSDAKWVVKVNHNIWSVFFSKIPFFIQFSCLFEGFYADDEAHWDNMIFEYHFLDADLYVYFIHFSCLVEGFCADDEAFWDNMIFDFHVFFCTHITKNWNCLLVCHWKSFLDHKRQNLILSLLVEC